MLHFSFSASANADGLLLCLQTEEQLKKRVGAKLEVAKFLQDTVSEMAKDMRTSGRTGAAQASAADLYQFMKRVSAST